MWKNDKIQAKKEYFFGQRRKPTGNFTEFVVRTYYAIYNRCADSNHNYCLAKTVNNHKIKYIWRHYDKPDHDYNGVINDCKKHLSEMGYIHFDEQDKYVFIDKPLDFLLPGEHEKYTSHGLTIKIEKINSQDEFFNLFNHMIDPIKYPDTYKENSINKSTGLACTMCQDGHFVFRKGQYGYFFGCSKYPKCKSTKKVFEITYSLLEEHGINIYEIEIPCWKCEKKFAFGVISLK